MANTRATADGFQGSAANPYSVSVGIATTPPLLSTAAARAIAAGAGRTGSTTTRVILKHDSGVLRGRDVNAVDEPDLVGIILHDHGTRPHTVAEEPHALHQRALGHARGGKDHARAGREIVRPVDPLEVRDAHRAAALFVLGFGDDEAGENFAIQTSHGCGCEYAFRCATGAHHGVHAGAAYCRR